MCELHNGGPTVLDAAGGYSEHQHHLDESFSHAHTELVCRAGGREPSR